MNKFPSTRLYSVDEKSTSAGTVTTAGSGLTLSGGGTTIDLGGALSANAVISDTANRSLIFDLFDGVNSKIDATFSGTRIFLESKDLGSEETFFDLNQGGFNLNYIGSTGVDQKLKTDGTSIVFEDDPLNPVGGLKYTTDLSSSFTSRSLIDQGYVESNFMNLGGAAFATDQFLNGVTRLNTDGFSLRTGTNHSHFFVNNSMTQLKTTNGTNTSIRYLIEMLNSNTDGIKVADNIRNKGLYYEADYSANWGDRHIVDKAYVDSVAGGIANSGAANELVKSDSTDVVGTGVFSLSGGNLSMGTGLGDTGRTIQADGSGTDVSLILKSKGTSGELTLSSASDVTIRNDTYSGNRIHFEITATQFIQRVAGADKEYVISGSTGVAGAGNDLKINAGSAAISSDADGGNLVLSGGLLDGAGSNGLIIMSNLPTADPSVTGALWNDAGTVKISA